MLNALINYKHLFNSVVTFLKNVKLSLAYVLINQHLDSLFSRSSQNQILMVNRGAFLVSRKTNLFIGVQPGSNNVTVQVMRGRRATDQAMHRFFWERLNSQSRPRFGYD